MIALIPARGGSKGLPRKNLLALAGKPLIQHSLESALAARSIDRVLVSTDDVEIAAVAAAISGVEVPFIRPAHLADDQASAIDVYLHCVDWITEHEGEKLEEICVLLPTSPLRIPDDIDGAIDLYRSRKADVVLSVRDAKPMAWYQQMDDNNGLSAVVDVDPQVAVANRQNLGHPPVVLNGSIYVLNIPALRRSRSYFGDRSYGFLMPRSRSVDIDRAEDFELAEAILRGRN